MSWHDYLVLEAAQPAGARIEIDSAHRESECDCDICGVILEKGESRVAINLQLNVFTGRGYEQTSVQLDLCPICATRELLNLAAAASKRLDHDCLLLMLKKANGSS